jgi:6-pyruvoyltetrahydropterin/6-carboxytetrahydropterin synthase
VQRSAISDQRCAMRDARCAMRDARCAVYDERYYLAAMPLSLTRRIRFAAAHRYRIAEWSDERNEQVFGLCARPSFHGHSYVCDVTVTGEVDPVTGMIVDLAVLDRILETEIRDRFDHRNINLDVPEFNDGGMVPTGENLARFIALRVQSALSEGIAVTEVRVAEDESLSATYRAD